MAVFTKISNEEIKVFLKNYSIGDLMSFEGIVKGTENTNYKIITSKISNVSLGKQKKLAREIKKAKILGIL